MTDEFVTIATYRTGTEAHLAKNLLEEEGITAVLAGEHSTELWGAVTNLSQGVQLQVSDGDADRARRLLESTRSLDEEAIGNGEISSSEGDKEIGGTD